MICKNCPACNEYNVFGVPDRCCCYKYHKYCEDVTECAIKQLETVIAQMWLVNNVYSTTPRQKHERLEKLINTAYEILDYEV